MIRHSLQGDPVPIAVAAGLCAAALSCAALLWRGRADAGSAAAPINATSHMFWPEEALRRDDVSLKHTATGLAVHVASSMFWGCLYGELRRRRRTPTVVNAVSDAAVIDLAIVPKRLSPGFEERLHPRSVALVFAAFGAGLAIAGGCFARR